MNNKDAMMQRTIDKTITIKGVGLQTGKDITLTLKGSLENSGITFIRADLPNKPSLNIQSLNDLAEADARERRTTLKLGLHEIQTTEHLLAALSGMGIDNIIVEMDGAELPGVDGSAKVFLDNIKHAGIVEQSSPKKTLDIKEPIWCALNDSLLAVLPDEHFRVSYTLSYPGIGTQFFDSIIDETVFENSIAGARTFCLEAEAADLLKRGLGKGANYENTLVMGSKGPINNTLRFPDEPVRHKVLDLMGDLYLVGQSLKARIIAIKSGHKLNMELVRKLREMRR